MNKINRIIELLESIDAKLTEQKKNVIKKKTDSSKTNQSSEFWNHYSKYYQLRWKVEPIRNSMVNGLIKTIISRVPQDDHQRLIHFFINQNDAWYLREMHHVRCLVKDCEMLLTRMKSNNVITTSKANSMENASNNINEAQIYLQNKRIQNAK